MLHLIRYAVFLSLLISIPALYASVYRWVDDSGIVHYSDQPHPGAQNIALPSGASAPMTAIKSSPNPASNLQQQKTVTRSISITQPHNDETIRNNEGYVPIGLAVTPFYKENEKIQIILDNTPVSAPQSATQFSVNNIDRGKHTLTAKLYDKEDNLITESQKVTFFMHKAHVGKTHHR